MKKGRRVFPVVLNGVVGEVDLRPDTPLQQPVVLVDDFLGNMHVLVAEVGEFGPVLVLAGYQANSDLVDDAMAAPPLQLGLCLLRLVGPDEVVDQGLVDDLQSDFDGGRVVGCAVLPEQVLEHVDRHVCPDLDAPHQVLADDPPWERGIGLGVERLGYHNSSSTVTAAATDAGADSVTFRSVRTS